MVIPITYEDEIIGHSTTENPNVVIFNDTPKAVEIRDKIINNSSVGISSRGFGKLLKNGITERSSTQEYSVIVEKTKQHYQHVILKPFIKKK